MVRPALKTALLVLLASTLGSIALSTHAEGQTFAARVFATGANDAIRLGVAPSRWNVNVEPINNTFAVYDVDVNSVRLISNGTGSVAAISPDNRHAVVGDHDANGIQDVEYSFFKSDLANLFSNFHGKKPRTVTVTLEGNLVSGGRISGQLTIQVFPG